MDTSENAFQVPPQVMHRAWRIVTYAGLLGSFYYLICIFGAPRLRFLTELGATPFDFGVISGLGSAVLAFQILGSVITNHLPRRKVFWMAIAITHRLFYIGVLVAPMLFGASRLTIWVILAAFFMHDALAHVSVPPWQAWMADLLPRESMTRYWAVRQRFITLANIVAMGALAYAYSWFEMRGEPVKGYILLSCFGLVLGMADILLFIWVPEPPNERAEGGHFWRSLLQPLRDPEFRPYLIYAAYWQFAVFVAAPFFGLYMLQELNMDVFTIQLLGIGAVLGAALSSRVWGLVGDSLGYRPILQVLTAVKVLTPLAYLITWGNPAVAIGYYCVVMFLDGLMNAGMDLSMLGVVLKSTPRRNRAMYIAAVNFLSIGIMAGIAPVISGTIIEVVNGPVPVAIAGWRLDGYMIVFGLSLFLRAGAVYFASRLRQREHGTWRDVVRHTWPTRALPVAKWTQRLNAAPTEEKRAEAARRLGQIKSPLAISELIYALQDTSMLVRGSAAHALGSIGASGAVEVLSRALFDPASGIQSPAARALGEIGDVGSLQALLKNLRRLDPKAQRIAINALARIGDDVAILPLIGLFDEVDDPDMRDHIAAALTRLCPAGELEDTYRLLSSRRMPRTSR